MLIYHPAFDAYHCVLRLTAIIDRISAAEFDKLRILDFCLCFPSVVKDFKLPRPAMFLRTRGKSLENPYRLPIGAKKVFDDQEQIHEASIGCMNAAGLIEVDDSGFVRRTVATLPEDVVNRCARLREEEKFFFEDCLPAFLSMPLTGIGGLKERSGLIEYRYDAT